jgi:hypothetical protein
MAGSVAWAPAKKMHLERQPPTRDPEPPQLTGNVGRVVPVRVLLADPAVLAEDDEFALSCSASSRPRLWNSRR